VNAPSRRQLVRSAIGSTLAVLFGRFAKASVIPHAASGSIGLLPGALDWTKFPYEKCKPNYIYGDGTLPDRYAHRNASQESAPR
jgi:hypothetical protein